MKNLHIGAYIAEKRKIRGLTQDELGEKLSVSGKAVSKWERGLSFPDLETVKTMANILMCRAENILNGKDDTSLSSEKECGTINEMSSEKKPSTAVIDFCDLGYKVSPFLFGGNLEHSRSAITGGLSAQMLRNRKFAGKPNSFRGNADEWFIIGEKTYAMVGSDRTNSGNIDNGGTIETYTRHSPIGYHMQRRFECNNQLLQNFNNEVSGIGQHGIYISHKNEYEFRIVLRTNVEANLDVALTSHNGNEIYAHETIHINNDEWNTYICFLKPNITDNYADLRITFTDKARIFVGAISLMPKDNFCGMRRDVISRLKEMNIKMLRWPGGNFAGEYNWLDGLLPCDMRAPLESYIIHLTQPHTMGYDFNEISTDDFIALCREINAEPSITLNLTWNTPKENAAWVEYCNGDENTEYGKIRIERGFEEPFDVKYWSLGNEAGYGHMEGENTPSGYYRIAKENAKAMLEVDNNLILCSSGYHPNIEWANDANNKMKDFATMAALHNYVNYPTYAEQNNKKQELSHYLKGVDICRNKIYELRSYLSPEISIAFDEWNCWYSWYRPGDTFTGIFAAKMLHMFISEQKNNNVTVSAIFQPINEGCICVQPQSAELTPMGIALSLISQHSNRKVLYISDEVAVSEDKGDILITLINDSYDMDKTFDFNVNKNAVGVEYFAEDIGPYTEFSKKDIVCKSKDGVISIKTSPLSISLIKLI